jgi:hypothetical protein
METMLAKITKSQLRRSDILVAIINDAESPFGAIVLENTIIK